MNYLLVVKFSSASPVGQVCVKSTLWALMVRRRPYELRISAAPNATPICWRISQTMDSTCPTPSSSVRRPTWEARAGSSRNSPMPRPRPGSPAPGRTRCSAPSPTAPARLATRARRWPSCRRWPRSTAASGSASACTAGQRQGGDACRHQPVGLLVRSPSDAAVDEIPQGDLDTARRCGQRVTEVALRLN